MFLVKTTNKRKDCSTPKSFAFTALGNVKREDWRLHCQDDWVLPAGSRKCGGVKELAVVIFAPNKKNLFPRQTQQSPTFTFAFLLSSIAFFYHYLVRSFNQLLTSYLLVSHRSTQSFMMPWVYVHTCVSIHLTKWIQQSALKSLPHWPGFPSASAPTFLRRQCLSRLG